jgi:uncharacterized protein (DUF1810 family)
MADEFDFNRFVEAQDPVIDAVCRELREGLKRTHWMWFVFPQLRGLGRSPTAQYYALDSIDAARAYLRHAVLGPRLIACTDLVNDVEGRTIHQIFGSPDDMKFHSSVTLFSQADPAQPAFAEALAKYFRGAADRRTIELLGSTGS